MVTLREFYRDKRVLLTGHTGFKGAWLSEWLNLLGARVTGYALAPESGRPSLFDTAGTATRMTSIIGDIRNRAALSEAVFDAQPEIVFHLAAQPLVRRSYHDPLQTYEVNVLGTAYLLDELRKVPSVRSVVVVTSDKCYDNQEWDWGYRESDALGGHDPYSSSKACAEIVTAAYRHSFFAGDNVGIATARAGNVIGGGDWSEDRIVPDIIRALMASRAVVLRSPTSFRPWQHVLEPLYGYLLLARRLWSEPQRFASAWNFGPDNQENTTVLELAEAIIRRWGNGSLEIAPSHGGHEAGALRLDCQKAARQLGWRARLSIEQVIELTVAWYEDVLREPERTADFTHQQIEAYMDLVAGTATPARSPAFAGS